MLALSELREYDEAEARRWAYSGMLSRYVPAWCPSCECSKSGDREEPNPRTEACTDGTCPCHKENP